MSGLGNNTNEPYLHRTQRRRVQHKDRLIQRLSGDSSGSGSTSTVATFNLNGAARNALATAVPIVFRAKASTAIQYSTTYTNGGSCSPQASHQIFPVLEAYEKLAHGFVSLVDVDAHILCMGANWRSTARCAEAEACGRQEVVALDND